MSNKRGYKPDTRQPGTIGVLIRGWPALLFAIGMIVAAVIAYLPRQYPPFPETRVHPSDMIVIDLAEQGGRYIAVGELGNILVTKNPEGKWHEAKVNAPHVSTLTSVTFVAEDVAMAVGHSGWILRSEDGGQTWSEVHFDTKDSAPLLDIAGPFKGKLYAIGAFNQFFVSTDLGRTWDQRKLDMKELKDEDKKNKSKSGNGSSKNTSNPFAAFANGGGIRAMAQLHYYDMAMATDGTLFMVGERGLVARSRDGGQTWVKLEQFYDGSFYGVIAMPNNRVLVYGMRGHAFVTFNGGKAWNRSSIPGSHSLFAGERTNEGTILLAGAAHTLLVSEDGGQTFRLFETNSRSDIAALLHISGKQWLTAGINGIDIIEIPTTDSNKPRSRS